MEGPGEDAAQIWGLGGGLAEGGKRCSEKMSKNRTGQNPVNRWRGKAATRSLGLWSFLVASFQMSYSCP